MANGIDHYREIVVERCDVYVIPMANADKSTINGWTLEQIAEDWFVRFSPNSHHATRDAYCLGGAARFMHYHIEPARVGAYVSPSLEPNGPTTTRTNTGSITRKGLLTGIKDRNGTPICTGDVIELKEEGLESRKWIVAFEPSLEELNISAENEAIMTVVKFWDRG